VRIKFYPHMVLRSTRYNLPPSAFESGSKAKMECGTLSPIVDGGPSPCASPILAPLLGTIDCLCDGRSRTKTARFKLTPAWPSIPAYYTSQFPIDTKVKSHERLMCYRSRRSPQRPTIRALQFVRRQQEPTCLLNTRIDVLQKIL
jgi:hypothetical protein